MLSDKKILLFSIPDNRTTSYSIDLLIAIKFVNVKTNTFQKNQNLMVKNT